jgi:hypothetical protein
MILYAISESHGSQITKSLFIFRAGPFVHNSRQGRVKLAIERFNTFEEDPAIADFASDKVARPQAQGPADPSWDRHLASPGKLARLHRIKSFRKSVLFASNIEEGDDDVKVRRKSQRR